MTRPARVAALTGQRGAMITAMALNSIAVALLIAGVIWLALALTPRSPRLALAGGVLGVFGLLAVLFDNGVAASFPPIVGGLDRIQATFVLDRIHSAAAITALGPLSITGDIGLALLGIAAVKAGAPRWAGAAIVAGALGEGARSSTRLRAVARLPGNAAESAGFAETVAETGCSAADARPTIPSDGRRWFTDGPE
jgi:hypothetical protein